MTSDSNTPPRRTRGHRSKTGQIRTARQYESMKGNGIRIRSKRLDQVDPDRLSLAYWLLAKSLVEDQTDPRQLDADGVAEMLEQLPDDVRKSDRRDTESS